MDKEAKEDNTFASKTFLSIDERFTLNATSMLDLAAKNVRHFNFGFTLIRGTR